MTRINLVPVEELMDQHLFAEFREIKMIPKALGRSLKNHTEQEVIGKIPKKYCLGKGHVTFFYDKGGFLHDRYLEIRSELARRGVNYNKDSYLDPENIMTRPFMGEWTPSPEEIEISRKRINEKIAMKPKWYRKSA